MSLVYSVRVGLIRSQYCEEEQKAITKAASFHLFWSIPLIKQCYLTAYSSTDTLASSWRTRSALFPDSPCSRRCSAIDGKTACISSGSAWRRPSIKAQALVALSNPSPALGDKP